MVDFDVTRALTIAAGGLGVVFVILILLALAIGVIRRFSMRFGPPEDTGKKKS